MNSINNNLTILKTEITNLPRKTTRKVLSLYILKNYVV
jgi:hypothetical protein